MKLPAFLKNRYTVLWGATALFAIGVLSIERCQPKKVTETEKIVQVEKEKVEEKVNTKTDQLVERITIKRDRPSKPQPPGCPPCDPIHEVEIREVIKTAIVDHSHKITDTQTNTSTERTKVTETVQRKLEISVAAGLKIDPDLLEDTLPSPVLTIQVQRRISNSRFKAGLYGRTDREFGIVLSGEFF